MARTVIIAARNAEDRKILVNRFDRWGWNPIACQTLADVHVNLAQHRGVEILVCEEEFLRAGLGDLLTERETANPGLRLIMLGRNRARHSLEQMESLPVRAASDIRRPRLEASPSPA